MLLLWVWSKPEMKHFVFFQVIKSVDILVQYGNHVLYVETIAELNSKLMRNVQELASIMLDGSVKCYYLQIVV